MEKLQQHQITPNKVEVVVVVPPSTVDTENSTTPDQNTPPPLAMKHDTNEKSRSPVCNSGKSGTPDRLKLPKAFKYPERYTSPTDQMMSPITRGILARSRKGSKLLPPSARPKLQELQIQELGICSKLKSVEIDEPHWL